MKAANDILLYGDSPLASAWLAASLEKKLSKQQYLKTSILDSTRAIEISSAYSTSSTSKLVSNDESESQLQFLSQTQPTISTQAKNNDSNDKNVEKTEEPMTLRISGQLLYGVVKIYSRKTRYLFEEVSLALIQLKSAFAISKSLTVPIEQTVVSSLDNITLKDKVTEANMLYDSETFDINKIFGFDSSSSRNTQMWTNSDSVDPDADIDYAMGDISIGRNNVQDHNDISDFSGEKSGVNFNMDFAPDNNNYEDEANQSIDALARRAEVPVDDLDGVDDFELPLDLDMKAPTTEQENNDIEGISNFQLNTIDNMDLEFTIDETHNIDANISVDANVNREEILQEIERKKAEEEGNEEEIGGEAEVEEEEEDDDDEEEEEPASNHKTKRRNRRKSYNYINNDVIRTHRKRIVVDEIHEIPTEQLKKNQREYPGSLRDVNSSVANDKTKEAYELIISDLQPSFLNMIGSSWKSIKRRRLETSTENDESTNFIEEISEVTDSYAVHDDIPEFSTMDDNFNQFDKIDDADRMADDIIPEFEVDANQEESLDTELAENDVREETVSHAVPLEEEGQDEEEEKEEGKEEQEDNDFDNYEDMKTRNKTTIEVAQELRTTFQDDRNTAINFENVVDSCKLSDNKKSSATRAFFELLVLGTANTVKLQQERLFGEITIESKQELFEKFL